jgi:uncharacterized protein (DUF2062 family)
MVYPKGGWGRAFHYVKHRVRRLPDSPERIARGIWAGVFTTFTPFFGLHFFVAAIIARVMRGNMIASLMATFFGNPLTYVPIGLVALKTGHWMSGTRLSDGEHRSFGGKFVAAGEELSHNIVAMFSGEPLDWSGLTAFYNDVFFPYMIGGIIPGIIVATICYYLSVPLIRAYQKRRKGAIKAKLEAIKKKAAAKAEAKRSASQNKPKN